ncbi:MAG: DNA-processing protein DprA [Candidatus Omnitrophica bacterium]|nr:DNA-processing protein DprA [Candidatus Omnitrophota bacterium]
MPLPSEELAALLLLNWMMKGSVRKLNEYFDQGVKPAELVERILSENWLDKAESLQRARTVFNAEKEIESCRKQNIKILTRFDEAYPRSLRQIYDPPVLLYVKGELLDSDDAAIAVVGSRHASFYGRTQAKRISRDLAGSGLTIVSGLARGIDQAAHEAALEINYGRSVAVMGCGLDSVYPPENRKLYDQLAERGALVSEYALGIEPRAMNFPIRNRIISGLSLGVLVVEAHARSGSLITAKEALEQGREVFAVPGPVDQLTSRGTHQLLKDGAYLVEDASDILQILAGTLRTRTVRASQGDLFLNGGEEKSKEVEDESQKPIAAPLRSSCQEPEGQLMALLSERPLTYDELMSRMTAAPGSIALMLVNLELGKRIHKNRDGRFALCP